MVLMTVKIDKKQCDFFAAYIKQLIFKYTINISKTLQERSDKKYRQEFVRPIFKKFTKEDNSVIIALFYCYSI